MISLSGRSRSLAVGLLAALATVAIHWLTLPPRGVPFIGLFSFTPLLLATSRLSSIKAAALAWGGYAATVLCCCSWLARTLVDFTDTSWIVASSFLVALAAVEGGRCALSMLVFRACRLRPEHEPLLFAAALVALDFVFPQLLAWPLGAPILSDLVLLQTVSWLGPSALSFEVGLASATLALVLDRRARNRRWVTGYVGVLVSIGLLGIYRLQAPVETSGSLQVGVVQGGNTPLAKRNDAAAVLRDYAATTRKLVEANSELDLVIWSETAVAKPLEVSRWHALLKERLSGGFAVPVLLGAGLSSYDGTGTSKVFNSALVFHRERSACDNCRYDKQGHVPFTEALPFGDALRGLFPRAGRLNSSAFSAPLVVGGTRIAAFICYESLDARLVSRLVRSSPPAELLVNVTNDGWFGRSVGGPLHFALARLRAIEQQRYLVRVAETGVSAVVDPRGRIVRELEPYRPGAFVADVGLSQGNSLFSIAGRTPLMVVCSLTLVLAWIRRRVPSAVAD